MRRFIHPKIDGDTICAGLARRAGQVYEGEHGVMFMPHDQVVIVKHIGVVKTRSGVILRAEHFYKVAPWQDDYARKLVHKLNYELHHDGAWSVMWSHPTDDGMPTQINFAYQDVDGDPQLVINSDRTLADMMTRGPDSHLENCERAYQQVVGWKKDMEIAPDQQIKWAKGQEQLDPNVQPEL